MCLSEITCRRQLWCSVSHTFLSLLLISSVAAVDSFSEAQTHLWPVCPFNFLSQGLFHHRRGLRALNTGLEDTGHLMPSRANLSPWSGGWWINAPTAHPSGGQLLEAFCMLPRRSQWTSKAATLTVYPILIGFSFLPGSFPCFSTPVF